MTNAPASRFWDTVLKLAVVCLAASVIYALVETLRGDQVPWTLWLVLAGSGASLWSNRIHSARPRNLLRLGSALLTITAVIVSKF